MTTIFVTRDPVAQVGRLRFAYDPDVVEVVKRFVAPMNRTWSPTGKTWTINLGALDDLIVHLRRAGHRVDDAHQPTAPAEKKNWADVLFMAVGPDRADAVFKALTRVLHPDVETGNTLLMQQLNSARRELPPSSRRRAA